jgi:hypothetical protein
VTGPVFAGEGGGAVGVLNSVREGIALERWLQMTFWHERES